MEKLSVDHERQKPMAKRILLQHVCMHIIDKTHTKGNEPNYPIHVIAEIYWQLGEQVHVGRHYTSSPKYTITPFTKTVQVIVTHVHIHNAKICHNLDPK